MTTQEFYYKYCRVDNKPPVMRDCDKAWFELIDHIHATGGKIVLSKGRVTTRITIERDGKP